MRMCVYVHVCVFVPVCICMYVSYIFPPTRIREAPNILWNQCSPGKAFTQMLCSSSKLSK